MTEKHVSIDPVRFGAAKYLKTSHAYYPVEARADLAKAGEALIAAASATDEAGPVVGVQKTSEDAEAINFVVTERGLLLAAAGRFYPFAAMKSQESHIEDKLTFRRITVEMEGGGSFELDVDSGRGKFRDAYAVSKFLSNVRARIRQTHAAYRPVPA
jgi:hypothetical protein